MQGKICVITGATDGIGKATARALVARGATVAIVGRNADKASMVIAEIAPGSASDRVQFFRADLADLGQVREAAGTICERFASIDVLINNAGLMCSRRRLTVDGFETTFAVNHLAHFLLTGLLLNRLRAASAGRIVTVSSAAHQGAQLDLDDLNGARRFSGYGAYGRSKLANLYFTFELARRLAGTGVTANAMHPGLVDSHFAHDDGWLPRLGMFLRKPIAISSEQGAETVLLLATAPELAGVSGKYFYKGREHPTSRLAQDEAIARRLWDASDAMTGFPYQASLLPPELMAPLRS